MSVVEGALELVDDQCKLLVSQHLQLLICHRHKRRQAKTSKRRVRVSSRVAYHGHRLGGGGISMIAFHLSSRELLHLRSLELAKKLIHGEGLIASRLYDSLDLHLLDLAIKSIEKLHSLLMIGVGLGALWLVRTHLVHNRLETTEHGVDALTRQLSKVLIFPPVSLIQPRLDMVGSLMEIGQPCPNLPGCEKIADTIELRTSETGDKSILRLAIDLVSPDLKFSRADRKVHVVRVHANLPDFGT